MHNKAKHNRAMHKTHRTGRPTLRFGRLCWRRYALGEILRILTIVLLIAVSGCVPTKKPDIDYSASNSRYNELVKKIEVSATQDDFIEIREIYVQTEYYKPYLGPERKLVDAILEGINNQEWSSCIESAQKVFSYNYISLGAHYGAMVCSFESGDDQRGKYHKYVLNNLLDAIWSTGDGKTIETAFYCTSTPELQAFLLLQGLETIDQALLHNSGKSYDLMGVKNPESGKEHRIYFDITAQWALGFKGLDL